MKMGLHVSVRCNKDDSHVCALSGAVMQERLARTLIAAHCNGAFRPRFGLQIQTSFSARLRGSVVSTSTLAAILRTRARS
jgi:hypothetical protein